MLKLQAALLASILAAVVLAGCTADSDAESVRVRHSQGNSLLALAVEDSSGDLSYGNLDVTVNGLPWSLGVVANHEARQYSVEGKTAPEDLVEPGDILRLPVTGEVDVELSHRASGEFYQSIDAFIQDLSAPSRPVPTAPVQGAVAVSRQTVFEWSAVSDPSGVVYELEYWLASVPSALGTERVTGIESTSHAVPPSSELLRATSYQWHVRAADGFGNVGAWSDVREFQTRQ